jgi:hypothetical protein
MATPSLFSPVKVGPRGREQTFVGGPIGANNPTRDLLKEAGATFGNITRVAQILSLGAGASAVVSLGSDDPLDVTSHLLESMNTDCEGVASELSTRLYTVDAYVRLNATSETHNARMDDWSDLGAIESRISAYVESAAVMHILKESVQYLQSRVGTATLGQISAYLVI